MVRKSVFLHISKSEVAQESVWADGGDRVTNYASAITKMCLRGIKQ